VGSRRGVELLRGRAAELGAEEMNRYDFAIGDVVYWAVIEMCGGCSVADGGKGIAHIMGPCEILSIEGSDYRLDVTKQGFPFHFDTALVERDKAFNSREDLLASLADVWNDADALASYRKDVLTLSSGPAYKLMELAGTG